jgi:hypothetical protein
VRKRACNASQGPARCPGYPPKRRRVLEPAKAPGSLSDRLLPILRRAGYIVPGHPAWREPSDLAAWYSAPQAEFGGRSWAQVHVPFTLEGRMRFAHAMDQIDREAQEVAP